MVNEWLNVDLDERGAGIVAAFFAASFSEYELIADVSSVKVDFEMPDGNLTETEYDYADIGTELPEVSRDGYRFLGWSTRNDVSAPEISDFRDAAQMSGYALEAVRWANAAGLVSGTSQGLLDPSGCADRAQIASILMRFCENAAQ